MESDSHPSPRPTICPSHCCLLAGLQYSQHLFQPMLPLAGSGALTQSATFNCQVCVTACTSTQDKIAFLNNKSNLVSDAVTQQITNYDTAIQVRSEYECKS
jgi:hypothetical protein